MALEAQRQEVEVIVVSPVKNGSPIDAEAAAVPLVRLRRVAVHLLLLHRQVEELPPVLPCSPHEARVHPVPHDLEEPPFSARVRHGLRRVAAAEVDDRDVDGLLGGGGG